MTVTSRLVKVVLDVQCIYNHFHMTSKDKAETNVSTYWLPCHRILEKQLFCLCRVYEYWLRLYRHFNLLETFYTFYREIYVASCEMLAKRIWNTCFSFWKIYKYMVVIQKSSGEKMHGRNYKINENHVYSTYDPSLTVMKQPFTRK